MIDMIDTADFDTELRSALRADALRAPSTHRAWAGPTVTAPASSQRRRPATYAAIATAAAAAAIAVFAVTTRRPDHHAATAFQPTGVEFTLQDLGVPQSYLNLTMSTQSREIGVVGHPPQIVATVLTYNGGAAPEVMRCTSEGGSSGCRGVGQAGPDISWTSSIDNHVADTDLWTWSNVPAGAAFVTYAGGAEVLWQRPIAGVAMFPKTPGDSEVAVAYSSSGIELGRVDQATLAAANAAFNDTALPKMADITQAQNEELSNLTDSSLGACLQAAGASIANDVATMPGGREAATWTDCVASAKATVTARVTAMGVGFYDPRTGHPKNPDPAFKTENASTSSAVPASTNPAGG